MKTRPRRKRLTILYDDDSVIAVDKPAGLTAVPIKGSKVESALSEVINELKRRRQRAYVVHRIDRFASGILLFAKSESAREVLVRQFLAHKPVREYLAVVRGRLKAQTGELIHYFRRDGMYQKRAKESDPEAARAELSYTVERPLAGATLVRVRLITGLQNQIRVQFLAIGHPIVGDRKYHLEESAERRIARVALHAAHLEFIHPIANKRVSIDCDPPSDFRSLVESMTLRRPQ